MEILWELIAKNKKPNKMKTENENQKLSKIKRGILNHLLILFILWVFVYLCFAFVLAKSNPFSWEQCYRFWYVFIIISISLLMFPLIQLIKSDLENVN